jgi:hypothetical protein
VDCCQISVKHERGVNTFYRITGEMRVLCELGSSARIHGFSTGTKM